MIIFGALAPQTSPSRAHARETDSENYAFAVFRSGFILDWQSQFFGTRLHDSVAPMINITFARLAPPSVKLYELDTFPQGSIEQSHKRLLLSLASCVIVRPMKNLCLITGGHRAGKTTMALKIAAEYPSKAYIATAEALDDEMIAKIRKHQSERDSSYHTIEEPLDLPGALAKARADVIIVDCITMWVNNILYYGKNLDEMTAAFYGCLENIATPVIIITNESSLSLIPGDAESRRYLNALAECNRRIAAMAGRVCMMVSGIPLWIKG